MRKLFQGFVRYHQNGPNMLRYMGWFGLLAYPALYVLRFFKAEPVYDDLWLRLVNGGLCILLLQKGWPESLKRYYMHFSYVALIIMLPFSMVFVGLQNQGGTVAVANAMMAIFLVLLLTDWRNTIVSVVIGAGLGVAAYLLVNPDPVRPRDYIERIPVVVVMSIAATLIKLALEKTTAERTTRLERQQREGRVAALQETVGFLAHELNTPLSEVRLLVGGVRDMYVKGPHTEGARVDRFEVEEPGDVLKMLERIEKRASYSQDLVQRLMRSAYHHRYDGGPQELTASSLVQSLLENYPFPDDRGAGFVDVVTVSDFVLQGSRELLYLVLSTLTQNSLLALKGQPSPRLVIEIIGNGVGQPGGMIRVTDNGCGVPPDLISKLAKEAVPSGWKDGHRGGGMGLMFAQRVLEANGGNVSVESMAGKGTSVTLTFRGGAADGSPGAKVRQSHTPTNQSDGSVLNK